MDVSGEAVELVAGAVCLRDWAARDLEALRTWWQPGHAWQEWDAPYLKYADAELRERRLESMRRQMADDTRPDPRIELCVASDGEFVGRVNRYWVDQSSGWLALGIDIYDPAYWARGVGTCALRLWLDYLAASELPWTRVDLRTWSGNERMVRLARRLGFREEARYRAARRVRGETYDALSFGLLRDEWRSIRPH